MSDSTVSELNVASDDKDRFAFGDNWQRFLTVLDDTRIATAEQSLRTLLGVDHLHGQRFLDVGSGSGLFSLVARRLGAEVVSFDLDPQSVACTQELRQRYYPDDSQWTVCSGSALDRDFLASLGTFQVVYSWGVLHHTGRMWEALAQVADRLAPGGRLCIALYNDQGLSSRLWYQVKRCYNRLPSALRFLVLWPAFVRIWLPPLVKDTLKGDPLQRWRSYGRCRGMTPWRDVVDWVGGYPFEVAKPEAVLDFYRARGFTLCHLTTCLGGSGCNEYIFQRQPHR